MRRTILLLLLPLATAGCVAQTAWNVATLPVKAGSKAVDWATTSQSEADRNYGRKMRKQEQRAGREHRELQKRCGKHPDDPACADLQQRPAANYR
ncbi:MULTISPECIES: hypothetical protein [unclassified Sphingomonas]|uniref:hypothetical protein n=1 Tax=unclassified Sphingomonas TaxID=196159 RepID=UPI001F59E401|nr:MULTISPECIES: hypothetical protein [unclassified Sphingomonas]